MARRPDDFCGLSAHAPLRGFGKKYQVFYLRTGINFIGNPFQSRRPGKAGMEEYLERFFKLSDRLRGDLGSFQADHIGIDNPRRMTIAH